MSVVVYIKAYAEEEAKEYIFDMLTRQTPKSDIK